MRQVIVNFHGLGTPERILETGEADYWVSPDLFAQTLDLAGRLKTKISTSFTFDDGNLSDLTIGAEGLASYGIKAQFFILSARIDQPGSLGCTDIQELQKMGHMIGTHGADHVDWKALGTVGLVRELDESRQIITEITGQPVTAAAIPFGSYNGAVMRALKSRGYSHIYSSDGGAWRSGHCPIPRTSPTASMTIEDIESILLGRESMKRKLRRSLSMAIKRRI